MNDGPSKITVIRHARSEGNECTQDERAMLTRPNHTFMLSDNGHQQIKDQKSNFIGLNPEFVFVSTYQRTKNTCELLFPGVQQIENALLDERHQGVWQTMTNEQIDEIFPYERDRKKKEGLYHHRPIAGENILDVEVRILLFLDFLKKNYPNKEIYIVGHGRWMIVLQKLISGMTAEDFIKGYKQNSPVNLAVHTYVPCSLNQLGLKRA